MALGASLSLWDTNKTLGRITDGYIWLFVCLADLWLRYEETLSHRSKKLILKNITELFSALVWHPLIYCFYWVLLSEMCILLTLEKYFVCGECDQIHVGVFQPTNFNVNRSLLPHEYSVLVVHVVSNYLYHYFISAMHLFFYGFLIRKLKSWLLMFLELKSLGRQLPETSLLAAIVLFLIEVAW